MIAYEMRFWDKINKRMIYGAGLSPNQLPIVKHTDGRLEELQGEFVPMINTGQKAVNGFIFEADVIECDVPAFADANGGFQSFMKARGIMQYNQAKGCFTLNIVSSEQRAGGEFQAINSRIIGCALANPELLSVNPNIYEQETTTQQESGEGAKSA